MFISDAAGCYGSLSHMTALFITQNFGVSRAMNYELWMVACFFCVSGVNHGSHVRMAQ